jgi:hypothetical protein
VITLATLKVFTLNQVNTRCIYRKQKYRFGKKEKGSLREVMGFLATAGVPGAEVFVLPGFPGVLGAEGAEGGGEEPASDITPGVTSNGYGVASNGYGEAKTGYGVARSGCDVYNTVSLAGGRALLSRAREFNSAT